MTPQITADLLIVIFVLVEVQRRRHAGTMAPRADRGTALVFWGCYAITLLALNFTIPSPVPAALHFGWLGTIIAVCGLGARVGMACADGVFPGSVLAPRPAGSRRLDFIANLAFWIGAAAASENLIVVLTVTVAMLPAAVLRNSAEKSAPDSQPTHGTSGSAGVRSG